MDIFLKVIQGTYVILGVTTLNVTTANFKVSGSNAVNSQALVLLKPFLSYSLFELIQIVPGQTRPG